MTAGFLNILNVLDRLLNVGIENYQTKSDDEEDKKNEKKKWLFYHLEKAFKIIRPEYIYNFEFIPLKKELKSSNEFYEKNSEIYGKLKVSIATKTNHFSFVIFMKEGHGHMEDLNCGFLTNYVLKPRSSISLLTRHSSNSELYNFFKNTDRSNQATVNILSQIYNKNYLNVPIVNNKAIRMIREFNWHGDRDGSETVLRFLMNQAENENPKMQVQKEDAIDILQSLQHIVPKIIKTENLDYAKKIITAVFKKMDSLSKKSFVMKILEQFYNNKLPINVEKTVFFYEIFLENSFLQELTHADSFSEDFSEIQIESLGYFFFTLSFYLGEKEINYHVKNSLFHHEAFKKGFQHSFLSEFCLKGSQNLLLSSLFKTITEYQNDPVFLDFGFDPERTISQVFDIKNFIKDQLLLKSLEKIKDLSYSKETKNLLTSLMIISRMNNIDQLKSPLFKMKYEMIEMHRRENLSARFSHIFELTSSLDETISHETEDENQMIKRTADKLVENLTLSINIILHLENSSFEKSQDEGKDILDMILDDQHVIFLKFIFSQSNSPDHPISDFFRKNYDIIPLEDKLKAYSIAELCRKILDLAETASINIHDLNKSYQYILSLRKHLRNEDLKLAQKSKSQFNLEDEMNGFFRELMEIPSENDPSFLTKMENLFSRFFILIESLDISYLNDQVTAQIFEFCYMMNMFMSTNNNTDGFKQTCEKIMGFFLNQIDKITLVFLTLENQRLKEEQFIQVAGPILLNHESKRLALLDALQKIAANQDYKKLSTFIDDSAPASSSHVHEYSSIKGHLFQSRLDFLLKNLDENADENQKNAILSIRHMFKQS